MDTISQSRRRRRRRRLPLETTHTKASCSGSNNNYASMYLFQEPTLSDIEEVVSDANFKKFCATMPLATFELIHNRSMITIQIFW